MKREYTNIGKGFTKLRINKSENFLLLNGDAIFNFNLKKILTQHKKK